MPGRAAQDQSGLAFYRSLTLLLHARFTVGRLVLPRRRSCASSSRPAAPFAAGVKSHNRFEVSTMANVNHAGVAGSWWLPSGTHESAEWNRHGGWEYLWWKPDGGEAYQVIERGTVANSLNRYEGPANAPG